MATSTSICPIAGSDACTASLANKITWPNTMQFFLMGICYDSFLSTSSTIGSTCAAKMNHHCHLRNLLWHAAVGTSGNGLSAWCLPCHKGGHIQHLWGIKKKLVEFTLSIFMLHVTILFTIQLYQFHEMCQGFMNTLHMYKMLHVFRFLSHETHSYRINN